MAKGNIVETGFFCQIIGGLCDQKPKGVCVAKGSNDVCSHAFKFVNDEARRFEFSGNVNLKYGNNAYSMTRETAPPLQPVTIGVEGGKKIFINSPAKW